LLHEIECSASSEPDCRLLRVVACDW
jgi:hypothetical protein